VRIAKTSPNSDLPVYSRSDFPRQAFGWSVLESWRADKYLYIRAPKPELYDLSADSNAAHNLAQSSKAILQPSPHNWTPSTAASTIHMQKRAEQN